MLSHGCLVLLSSMCCFLSQPSPATFTHIHIPQPPHPPLLQLCHNEISAHNAAFYKLLDELWGEAEELMDKGITGSGAGFDAPSAGRLGSHAFIPIHNPPEHRMAEAVRKVR